MARKGVLVVYVNEGANLSRANRLSQRLWGQETTTRGKVYQRHGLMEDIPHWRIKRGVVVVSTRDRERVVRLLKDFVTEVYWWEVTLNPWEWRRLHSPTG